MAKLRLFANLRELAGTSRLDVPSDTVGGVIEVASEKFGPDFRRGVETARVWVNGESAAMDDTVTENDEVVLLPPVSGGDQPAVSLAAVDIKGFIPAAVAVVAVLANTQGQPIWAAALVLIAPAFRWPGVLAAEAGPEAAARWEREGTIVHDAGFRTVTLGWDLVRGGAAFPLERLAASLATPTLLLQGTRDASCPWRDSARFAEETAAPDVDLRLLEGGDHRLTDRRDLLADAAHAFLAARGL